MPGGRIDDVEIDAGCDTNLPLGSKGCSRGDSRHPLRWARSRASSPLARPLIRPASIAPQRWCAASIDSAAILAGHLLPHGEKGRPARPTLPIADAVIGIVALHDATPHSPA